MRKYQEGGQLTDTQQQGLQYLAQMYTQQTGKDPQQDQEGFMQFVQQLAQQAGVQDIGQLLDMVYQQAQGQAQAQMARRGAKLNYLKRLSGRCPAGEQLVYFKAGGRVCSKCMSKKKDKSKMNKASCGSKIKKALPGGIFNKITPDFIKDLVYPERLYSDTMRNNVIQRQWRNGKTTYVPYTSNMYRQVNNDLNKLKNIYLNPDVGGPASLPNVEVYPDKVRIPNYRPNPFRKQESF